MRHDQTMTDHIPFLTHPLLDHPGISHGFFTRHGGVSQGVYDSLNGGLGSKDNRDHVDENRLRAATALGGKHDLICGLYQIHSALCHIVDNTYRDRKEGDAMVTTTAGVTCVILTADCVPVLFADPVHHVIAAAHAGWRGAVSGVVASTIAAMEDAGASRDHIVAVTGPAIQQQSYQVGADLRAAVCDGHADASVFFQPDEKPQHWRFDLPGYVKGQLIDQGVTAAAMPDDTYADDRFFSHRHATHHHQPDSGRLMAMIRLNQPALSEK